MRSPSRRRRSSRCAAVADRLRKALLVATVIATVACTDLPRPSPSAGPVATPEACRAILARGGTC